MKITEKIDFNLSMKDIKTMTSIMNDYIADRNEMFTNVFCSDGKYNREDMISYVCYMTNNPTKEMDIHPYVYRLLHFLSRNYEIFIIPEIAYTVGALQDLISGAYFPDLSTIDKEEFEALEFSAISELNTKWNKLVDQIKKYPLLNLDKLEYLNIEGCSVYYTKDTQPIILKGFENFVIQMSKDFPVTLKRFDTFLLVPPDYIELVAGNGTYAFYLDDAIFFSNQYDTNELELAQTVFYHEFGHFIFELLSETYQIYWYDCYDEWVANGTQLSREKGKNEVEELWADAFSCLYFEPKDPESFIQKPSEIIIDVVRFILSQEFIDNSNDIDYDSEQED